MLINTDLFTSFEIELSDDEVQGGIHRKLETDAPTRGFRSASKMPLSYILKKYGEQFLTEVMQELLKKRMDAVIAAKGYDVAGGVQIASNFSFHDRPLRYRYVVTFETYPKFDVQGLDTLRLNAPAPTVIDDSHIDTALQILQRERSTWKPVARAAQRGDRVTINFDSFLEDGQAFPGGKADNVNVELGAGGMLPEFENAIIGLRSGVSVDFPVHFPENYGTPFLAGKTACFTVLVLSICEFELVPLDDSFAERCNVAGGMAALRKATRIHLQQQHADQDQRDIASDLLRQLAEKNPIRLPATLVAQQLQQLQRQTAEAQGVSLEQIQIDDSLIDRAQVRVHLSILARRLIVQEGIAVDEKSELTDQVVAWLKDRAAKNTETPPS